MIKRKTTKVVVKSSTTEISNKNRYQQQGIFKYLFIVIVITALALFMIPGVFSNLKYGLDLQGGFEILYEVSSLNKDEKLDKAMLTNTHKNLLRRIDTLGVSEPVIEIEGDNRIRVQLAGVTDQETAREALAKPAVLSFRDSKNNLLMTSDVLTSKGASEDQDNRGLPAVKLSIAKKDEFYRVTKRISETEDKLIIIWLDYEEGLSLTAKEVAGRNTYGYEENGKFIECGSSNSRCLSAATVSEGFSSDVIIQGSFTKDEVKQLVDFINSGNLPTKLKELSSRTVQASFGEKSLEKTYTAGIIGIALVALIMILLYRFAGFISAVGLLIYTVITFGIFWLVGGVLTLQGIAAMLLGIGMAVDANVLSFSRIKDELAKGSSLIGAFKKGNTNSIKTIIDANVTTLLVAVILFIFGESSTKGFATMLIISIFVTMIVMVVVVRLILRKFVETKRFDDKVSLFVGKPKKKQRKINFVKNGMKFLIISGICIIAGIVSLVMSGLNLGVDFKGGTSITVNADMTEKEIKEELKGYTIDTIDMNSPITIKIEEKLSKKKIDNLEKTFETKYQASADINTVSNIVMAERVKNAIYSVILGIIGMIIYISIRFKFNFGISSIICLAHDVFIIIAVFSLLKLEVSAIFVAAILSIIGYSINNTIVVFDRIRENTRKKQIKTEEELAEVVNDSIAETLYRSVITSITTMLPVICLIVFGSKEILNFNIALLIGLIAGTYSSILLAGVIWIKLDKKNIGKKPTKKWYEIDTKSEKLINGINS